VNCDVVRVHTNHIAIQERVPDWFGDRWCVGALTPALSRGERVLDWFSECCTDGPGQT
jgi:hypothetical protein